LICVTFFDELNRRKVYRVAVAYVIAAGGIIQLASAVFPAWQLPDWMLRVVVVLLLAGFPLALILAWAFVITPQGIQTTPAAPSSAAQYFSPGLARSRYLRGDRVLFAPSRLGRINRSRSCPSKFQQG
jgi:hypothetical protein